MSRENDLDVLPRNRPSLLPKNFALLATASGSVYQDPMQARNMAAELKDAIEKAGLMPPPEAGPTISVYTVPSGTGGYVVRLEIAK